MQTPIDTETTTNPEVSASRLALAKSMIQTIEHELENKQQGYEAIPKISFQQNLFKSINNPLSLGMIILILINCLLCFTQPFANIDPATLPATHTWTWWATQEYLNDKPTPPVVLIGSSLFMHSVSRQDADFLNKDLDYVHHHYSAYLSKQLQKRFHSRQSLLCFNFSLPGDLVSDDYMIMRGLFQGKHKPQYVILGLSLRDFVDNAVNCPGSMPPFRYLRRFTDIDDIVNLAFPRLWQRFDYYIGKFFYPWAKKLDIQAWASEQTKLILAPLAQKLCAPSLLNELDYRKHVPANLHSEVEEGMAIVKTHIPYNYDANYADYIRRYGKGNSYRWMFNIQEQFFARLVPMAKAKQIKLIIVNMPLTKDNMNLVPAGAYERYINLLKTQASKYDVPFMDLNQNAAFVKSDFYDTAHMTSTGGKKLLDMIANTAAISL